MYTWWQASGTFVNHFKTLAFVLVRLKKANMKVFPSKHFNL